MFSIECVYWCKAFYASQAALFFSLQSIFTSLFDFRQKLRVQQTPITTQWLDKSIGVCMFELNSKMSSAKNPFFTLPSETLSGNIKKLDGQ